MQAAAPCRPQHHASRMLVSATCRPPHDAGRSTMQAACWSPHHAGRRTMQAAAPCRPHLRDGDAGVRHKLADLVPAVHAAAADIEDRLLGPTDRSNDSLNLQQRTRRRMIPGILWLWSMEVYGLCRRWMLRGLETQKQGAGELRRLCGGKGSSPGGKGRAPSAPAPAPGAWAGGTCTQ